MRTNGKCNNSHAPLALAQAIFCFPSEPNIPEEPQNMKNINTIVMYWEKIYKHHAPQRQLLRPLNNLEKRDPSEIENLQYKITADSGFIDSVHENVWKVQQFSRPL